MRCRWGRCWELLSLRWMALEAALRAALGAAPVAASPVASPKLRGHLYPRRLWLRGLFSRCRNGDWPLRQHQGHPCVCVPCTNHSEICRHASNQKTSETYLHSPISRLLFQTRSHSSRESSKSPCPACSFLCMRAICGNSTGPFPSFLLSMRLQRKAAWHRELGIKR